MNGRKDDLHGNKGDFLSNFNEIRKQTLPSEVKPKIYNIIVLMVVSLFSFSVSFIIGAYLASILQVNISAYIIMTVSILFIGFPLSQLEAMLFCKKTKEPPVYGYGVIFIDSPFSIVFSIGLALPFYISERSPIAMLGILQALGMK